MLHLSSLPAATVPDPFLWVGAGVLALALIVALFRHGGFLIIGLAALLIAVGFAAHLGWTPNPELWGSAPVEPFKSWSHLAVSGGMALCFVGLLGIALRPGRVRRPAK